MFPPASPVFFVVHADCGGRSWPDCQEVGSRLGGAGKAERVFPVAILGLFGTGAYMTSDVWTWGTRWIDVSIAGLVLVALQGPLLAGTRAKALERALHENGPGPLGERARRMTRDPVLWVVTFVNP